MVALMTRQDRPVSPPHIKRMMLIERLMPFPVITLTY